MSATNIDPYTMIDEPIVSCDSNLIFIPSLVALFFFCTLHTIIANHTFCDFFLNNFFFAKTKSKEKCGIVLRNVRMIPLDGSKES